MYNLILLYSAKHTLITLGLINASLISIGILPLTLPPIPGWPAGLVLPPWSELYYQYSQYLGLH